MDKELRTTGLVVRETSLGEADKILTLICAGVGRIDVSAKGVRSLRSPHMAATQIFAYSSFILRRGKRYYYIAESELIEPFFGLRSDLDRLSLAAYVADVLCDVMPEELVDDDILRLGLNTYFAISEKKDTDLRKIKAAFEFKIADLAGFCPDLSCCRRCGITDGVGMNLDVMNGGLVCSDCKRAAALEESAEDTGTAVIQLPLTDHVLAVLRYITSVDEKRFLSFRIPEEELPGLAFVCERYLLDHLGHGFHSLDFYKSILV